MKLKVIRDYLVADEADYVLFLDADAILYTQQGHDPARSFIKVMEDKGEGGGGGEGATRRSTRTCVPLTRRARCGLMYADLGTWGGRLGDVMTSRVISVGNYEGVDMQWADEDWDYRNGQ